MVFAQTQTAAHTAVSTLNEAGIRGELACGHGPVGAEEGLRRV
jgi:hypothetical protein